MAAISKRKDTVGTCWQAIIRRRGYPQQSKTFPTKAMAEEWAALIEADMRRGIFQSGNEAERTKLTDLIEDFKSEFAPKHYRIRADGKEAWRFQLARLDELLGGYSLLSLDRKIVGSYRDKRLSGSQSRKPVSESTVRKELYLLSKVIGFAQMEKGITLPRGNPVENVRKPSEGQGRTRRLDSEEWAKFEVECKKSRNPWLWPAVQLAVETAMRQGELLSIGWQQIDYRKRLIFLDDPSKLKNEEPRAVPLSPKAIEVLRALHSDKAGPLLPVERQTLYRAFRYACDRALVINFTFHDLRHEALSRLAERGDFSVLEMAEISGHKTLQMLKRYTHLRASKLADKLATKSQ